MIMDSALANSAGAPPLKEMGCNILQIFILAESQLVLAVAVRQHSLALWRQNHLEPSSLQYQRVTQKFYRTKHKANDPTAFIFKQYL